MICGAGPAGAAGTVSGYDQVNAPEEPPACQEPLEASGVALKVPPAPPPESTAPTTAVSPLAAAGVTEVRYAARATEGPVAPGVSATAGVTVPSAAVSTVAVIVWVPVSLVVSSSSYVWHASTSGVVR